MAHYLLVVSYIFKGAVQRYFQSRKRCQHEAEKMPVQAREAQNKKRKIRARKVRVSFFSETCSNQGSIGCFTKGFNFIESF